MSNILRATGLEKRFISPDGEELRILRGIDFAVDSGDMISIVGASGTGKTTLLHLLGLLDHPTNGNIFYLEKDVTGLTPAEQSRFRNRNIGFIFQMHYLLPEFTAFENGLMPAIIRGERSSETEERCRELFEKVGLGDRMNHKPGQLSGGEQQRTALVRAFMGDPRVILADEPTGNLDKKNAMLVTEQFLKLNRERGTALVMVTHNEELAGLMDTKYRIDDGLMEKA